MRSLRQRCAPLLFAALSLACSNESETDPVPDGGGGSEGGCAPGEVERDGACFAAGVLPEMCAAGFEHDGRAGCTPVLPPTMCPAGQMAIMGETTCREVAPCGSDIWGDAPVDSNTQYVDAAYAGGNSTGSATQPWTTVGEAITAAAPGSIVAIAAGNYGESLDVSKPVKLWGRCPSMVSIEGTDSAGAAVFLYAAADGAELHDLALSGTGLGLAVLGADDVVADRVWIHDTASWGVVAGLDGPASVTLSRSLIEAATELGIHNSATHVTVEASVVRGTRENAGQLGRGINAESHSMTLERATLEVRNTLVEDNRSIGIFVGGSDGTVEASVVRGTRMSSGDSEGGVGVHARQDASEVNRGNLTINTSLIHDSQEFGLSTRGSDLVMEATVVRDTGPIADGTRGFGLNVDSTELQRGQATVRYSLFDHNHSSGIAIVGADAKLHAIAVNDTQSQLAGGLYGRGATVQFQLGTSLLSSVVISSSSFDANHEAGIVLVSSTLDVSGSAVRATAATGTDFAFGDGLVAVSQGAGPPSLTMRSCLVDDSARAGVAALGAIAFLRDNNLSCNPIQLTAGEFDGQSYTLEDAGGNSCGCGDEVDSCTVVQATIEPPSAL